MNTARDVAVLALAVTPGTPVEQGDVSLVLAGAELLDLAEAGALAVEADRVVPTAQAGPTGDPLLDEAARQLVREEPYEPVEDWLWRRGRGLAETYCAALETEGVATRVRGRRLPVLAARAVPPGSPERLRAERRVGSEPAFAVLAATAGLRPGQDDGTDAAEVTDETVASVLAAVGDAVMELEGVRQRRAVENAAFDNIWRSLG